MSRVTHVWRTQGTLGLAATVRDRALQRRSELWPLARVGTDNRNGLEIGGASSRFGAGGLLPSYDSVASLDNVNFASATLWEPQLRDGGDYAPAGRTLGVQHLAEASDLGFAADEQYDFLLSSHTLEHVANPLKTLREWRRVVRPGGTLVMVLPHHEGTFDRQRPVTSLAHLQADADADVGEDDDTHLPEILALHDLHRDPGMDADQLRDRLERNIDLRSAHHHVFNLDLVVACLFETGWGAVAIEARRPYDIVAVARKVEESDPGWGQSVRFGNPFTD